MDISKPQPSNVMTGITLMLMVVTKLAKQKQDTLPYLFQVGAVPSWYQYAAMEWASIRPLIGVMKDRPLSDATQHAQGLLEVFNAQCPLQPVHQFVSLVETLLWRERNLVMTVIRIHLTDAILIV